MPVDILSVVAVAGAWVAGLGIIFAVAAFCFGIIRPGLFRVGIIYLLASDVGAIAMLAALLGIIDLNQNPAVWVFSLVGVLALLAITVAAFIIVRGNIRTIPAAATAIETTRRRIEF